MKIGQQGWQAQILYFDDRLGHRGINKAYPRSCSLHIARTFKIGPGVVDDGGHDTATQQQAQHTEPQQTQGQRFAQNTSQGPTVRCAGRNDHQRPHQTGRASQTGQGIGQ